MAEKRMFTKKITDSDAFVEMSPSAQALYFHLNQGADDDGFNNQIQNAMFKAHASIDDLKVLLTKNFIIRFESGVVVIKHWWMHNTLRKDRYTPTNFQEELSLLGLKDNNAYTLNKEEISRLPFGCHLVAVDKNRLEKISEDKNSKEEDNLNNNNKLTNNVRVCELFEKVKSFVGLKVSSVGYSCYFEKLECVGVKEDKLVLSASSFTSDAIDSGYRDLLIEAIKEASENEFNGYLWG